ncbi:MAG: DNA-processing protein DprA [Gammaproteobacteria bacterium]
MNTPIPSSLASWENEVAWLALIRAPRVGARTIRSVLERFPRPLDLLGATREEQAACGLNRPALDYLREPDWSVIESDIHWLEQPNNWLITISDRHYPALLRDLPDPPGALFVCGDPRHLSAPQLAVVGSRNPTPAGRETALEFARYLTVAGLTITSGLASGIDGAAHEGALSAGGATIAVVGTGLDRVYPAEHRDLAHRIAESGALVSEFPLGTPPLAGNFPRRNRLISGMSLGTLVVEATPHSGSLITARLAGEQGREVFAIPGSIHNPQARGCHALIRQGAKLVETANDILEELGPLAASLVRPEPESVPEEQPAALDADYQALLQHIDQAPTSIDTVVERSGLTVETVSSMLLLLELQGYVSSAAGGRYVRTRS